MNPAKLEKYKRYTDKKKIKDIFEDKKDKREALMLALKNKRSLRKTLDWQSRNHIEKIKNADIKIYPEELLTDGGSRSG